MYSCMFLNSDNTSDIKYILFFMFLNSDNTSDIKYICFSGTVIDGAATTYNIPSLALDGDIDYQSDITTVSMQFAGFTSHLHGVMAYEWSVGTTPGGEEVMPFTTHGIIHKEERNVPGDGKCVLCLSSFFLF